MTKSIHRKLERLEITTLALAEFDNLIIKRITSQKSSFKACPICGSKINILYVKSVKCLCCSSDEFGYTKTDTDKLLRLKELKVSLENEISSAQSITKTVVQQTTPFKNSPVIKDVKYFPTFTVYIKEYGADGETGSSFKENLSWSNCGTPSNQDAANELGYPVGSIILVVKKL